MPPVILDISAMAFLNVYGDLYVLVSANNDRRKEVIQMQYRYTTIISDRMRQRLINS
jgi:hypothetical protein